MDNTTTTISDLENLISETICMKIEKWNLYLGDAGLSRRLAVECISNIKMGSKAAAESSLKSIFISIGEGNETISLYNFISKSQVKDLEDILDKLI
tara:strand:- start:1029 stop:1316 length:288 start_codon:yes stop_codon:yes gene_type:complete